MNTTKIILASMLLASTLAVTNAQATDRDDLIQGRQGLMTLYGINMDILGDMIRNKRPYNKKVAQMAADNLLSLAKLNNAMLWPRGSSLADRGMKGKTSAKPDIWNNTGDVSGRQQDLIGALEVLAKNAAWSVDSLEEAISDVNAACKSCHKKYRSKK